MRLPFLLCMYLLFLSGQSYGQDSISHKRVVFRPYDEVRIVYQARKNQEQIPDGYFKVYFQNKLQVAGHYVQGKRDGKWTRFFSNGKPRIEAEYTNGQKTGEWKSYYFNRNSKSNWHYAQNLRVNVWQSKSKNGDPQLKAAFDSVGTLQQVILYNSKGAAVANYEWLYNGQNQEERRSLYYDNYRIFSYQRWLNGVLDGPAITYHKNGIVWESFLYKNGKLWQVDEMNSRSRQALFSGSFFAGEGELRRYYPNGLKYSYSQWKNGEKNGLYQLFDNGIEAVNGSYRNNQPIGKWTIHDGYHNPHFSIEFKPALRKVFVKELLSSNKREAELGHYNTEWQKVGEWQKVNIYNEPTEIAHYTNGLLDGHFVQFDFGGVKRVEGVYNYGEKNYEWKYRNSASTVIYRENFDKKVELKTWRERIEKGYRWVKPPVKKKIHPLYFEFDVGAAAPRIPPPPPGRVLTPLLYAVPNWAGTELLPQPEFNLTFEERFIRFERNEDFEFIPQFLPPRFESGMSDFDTLLKNLLQNSKKSRKIDINGKLWVLLKVDELGIITSCETVKTLGKGADDIVELLIKQMPPLLPAEYQGIPVGVYMLAEVLY